MGRRSSFLVFLATTTVIGTPAFAQQQPATQVDAAVQNASAPPSDQSKAAASNADIIVTATRQAKSLKNTPLAVDVVSGAQVAKLNLFDIKEIQNVVPGLSLTNNDGRSNVATLRGISFNPDSGSGAAVEVYFNEVSVDANTFFSAIYDIGQIEVLRGPQGLFRGQVSPAGAIVVGSARADLNELTGYAQATGTDRHAYNLQGAVSVPIVPGKLALRASMLADSNRGANIRNIDGRHSKIETLSGRLSLAWRPSPAFRADLTYQYTGRDAIAFRSVFGPGRQTSPNSFFPLRSGPAIGLEDRLSVTEGNARFTLDTHIVTLNLGYDLGPADLVFNGGYQNTQLTADRDQDVANAVPHYTLPQVIKTPYALWKSELRLQSKAGHRLNWAVSGNYNHSDFDSVRVSQRSDYFLSDPFGFIFPGMTAPGPVPPQIFVVPVDVQVILPIKSHSYAISGLLGYELFDGFTLTGGLRKTWGKATRTQTTLVPAFGINSTATTIAKTSPLTGGASATWELNRAVTIYANYGRSFRAGVFATGVSTPLDPSITKTPDEKSDGYEVGVKTNLFERKVSLNLAAFYQKFKNYVDFNPALTTNSSRIPGRVDSATAPLSTYGNAISKGVEMQLTVRPSTLVDLNVNAAYADAHYDNALVFCNDYNGDGIPDSTGTPSVPGTQQIALCARNDRISEVPKFSLSANGEARFPTGRLTPFLRGLVSYRPGYHSGNTNYTYRTFTKIDLFVGVRGPNTKWEATLFAKNVLNQTRALNVSSDNFVVSTNSAVPGFPALPFNSGYRLADVTAPREFGGTLRFNW